MQETSLYLPVKRFLEGLGFSVKGEIGNCDAVAISGSDPPIVVVCELKLQFNLDLVLQGVNRAAACDEVWLAARLSRRGKGRESDPRFRALCRRLGFGLLGITANDQVEVVALLIDRVNIGTDGLQVRLRVDGLNGLAQEMRDAKLGVAA